VTALTANSLAAALLEVRQDFAAAGDGDAERAVRMTVAASEVMAVADVLAEPGLDTQGRQGALGERSQDAAAGAIKLARGDLGCATWQLSPPPDGVAGPRRSDGSDNSLLDSLPGINSALRTASEVERYLQGGGTAPDASADDGRLFGGEFATGTTQLTPNAAAAVVASKAIAAALALAPHPTDNLVASLTSMRQVSEAARVTLLAAEAGAPPAQPGPLPATQTDVARAISGSGGSGAAAVPQPPHSGGHVSESPPVVAGLLGQAPTGPAPSPWSSRITPGGSGLVTQGGGLRGAAGGGDPQQFPVMSLSAFPAPSPMQLASLQLQQLHQLHQLQQLQQRQLSQEYQGWLLRSEGQPLTGDSLHLRMSPDPDSLPLQPPSQPPHIAPLVAPPPGNASQGRGAKAAGSETRSARAAAAAAGGVAAWGTVNNGAAGEAAGAQTGTAQRALAIVSPRRGGGDSGAAADDMDYNNVVPATFPSPLALAMDNTQGTQGGPGDQQQQQQQQQQQPSVQLQPLGAAFTLQNHPLAALFGMAVAPASAAMAQQHVLQQQMQMQQPPPPILQSGHGAGNDGSVPRGTVLLPALNDPGRLSSPPLTSPPEDEPPFTGGDAPSVWGTDEAELSARPAAWKALSRMGQAGAGQQQRRMAAPPPADASQQAGAVAAAARARARAAAPARDSGAPVTRAERLNVPASRLFHDDGGGGGGVNQPIGSSDPFAFPDSQHEDTRPSRLGAAKQAGDGWRASKQAVAKAPPPVNQGVGHPHGAGFAAFSPAWGAAPRVQPAARDAGLAAAAVDSDDDAPPPARGGGQAPAGNPRRRQAAAAAAVSPSSGAVVPRRGGGAKRRQPLVIDDSSESDGDAPQRGHALDALAKVARGRERGARGKASDGDADPDDETYVPSLPAGKAGGGRGTRNAAGSGRGKGKPAAVPERRSERKRKPAQPDAGLKGEDREDEEGDEEEAPEKPQKRTRGGETAQPGRLFEGVRFLTTGYAAGSSGPRSDLEKLLKEHGGTLLADVPPPGGIGSGERCIVVASSFVRTPKLLYALAANMPLVKPGWVQACVAAGRMLAPPHPRSSKGGEYGEHAFTEAPPLLAKHSPCMAGAVIVLAGAQNWTPSLGIVLRYAGAQVTEIDTSQQTGGAQVTAGALPADATRRASVPYDTPGLIPRGAVVVSQTEKPPRRLAAAVAALPGCGIVRTEWAVQCLLQRRIVDTVTYAAMPVTPGADVKPNLGAAVAAPGRQRGQPKEVEEDAALPPVPPQAVHPLAPAARPAEAAASRRDSGAHAAVLGTPDSSVRGAAGVGKAAPGPRGDEAAPAQKGAKAPKRPRCLEPVPQNDLFAVEADCAGCSTAFKKVRPSSPRLPGFHRRVCADLVPGCRVLLLRSKCTAAVPLAACPSA
jgi:hypothetical protein